MITTGYEKPLSNDFMTLREAAKAKGAKPDTLRKWIKRHKIPYSFVGREIVVKMSLLDEYWSRL